MTPEAEVLLVKWFLLLYESRSNSTNPMDIDPHYRVTWTEIYEKMKEFGCTLGVVDARLLWNKIQRRHRLITSTDDSGSPID